MDEEHYYTTLDLYNVTRSRLAKEKMLTSHLLRLISQIHSAHLAKNEDALRESFEEWEDWNIWLSQLRVWEHQEKEARKGFLKKWLAQRAKVEEEERRIDEEENG